MQIWINDRTTCVMYSIQCFFHPCNNAQWLTDRLAIVVWLTYSWLKKNTFTQTPTNNNSTHIQKWLQLNAQCNKKKSVFFVFFVYKLFRTAKGFLLYHSRFEELCQCSQGHCVFVFIHFKVPNTRISVQKISFFNSWFHFLFIQISKRHAVSQVLVH